MNRNEFQYSSGNDQLVPFRIEVEYVHSLPSIKFHSLGREFTAKGLKALWRKNFELLLSKVS